MHDMMRSTHLRAKALALALVLGGLFLTGCGQRTQPVMVLPTQSIEEAEPTPPPKLVSQGLDTGIVVSASASMHPLITRERDYYSYHALMFESLVELDDTMRPVPLLADRWEVEGKTWTFTLRRDVVFHNGNPLTAQDVADSFEFIRNLESDGPYAKTVEPIESVEAVDERTVKVKAKAAGYLLLYAMTFPVVNSPTLGDDMPRGTGPYWCTQASQGEMLRLEANPLWWQVKAELPAITARNFGGIQAALSAFETRQIDLVSTRSMLAPRYRGMNDRLLSDYSTQQFECLIPNVRRDAFSDPRARQALAYAIDRAALVSNAYLATVVESETPVQPGTFLYESQTTKFVYSPERALKLMMDAGFSDGDGDGMLDRVKDGLREPLQITILTYEEPDIAVRGEAASLIAAQLSRLGIDVKVSVKSRGDVQYALEKGDFDLVLAAFNIDVVPDLTYCFGSRGGGNYGGYQSEEMDSLLARAQAAQTEEELRLALSQIQIKAVEDMPVAGLFFRTGTTISRDALRLKGARDTQTLRGIARWSP